MILYMLCIYNKWKNNSTMDVIYFRSEYVNILFFFQHNCHFFSHLYIDNFRFLVSILQVPRFEVYFKKLLSAHLLILSVQLYCLCLAVTIIVYKIFWSISFMLFDVSIMLSLVFFSYIFLQETGTVFFLY